MTEHVRRIDRILAPDYLEGLNGRSLDELRTMERDVIEVETEMSYVRRLAQGRIDILAAEADRRAAGGALGDLSAALVTDGTLANLPNLTDAELQATVGQLRELERDVSERRRALHVVLDSITHAVASRLAPDPAG